MNVDTPFLGHRELGFFVFAGRISDKGKPRVMKCEK